MYVQFVYVMWHSALSLSHFYNCLLCDGYTCQYLRTASGNMHVFIQGRRGPCKNICTTFYPRYGNVCYLVTKRTNRHQTNKQTSTWRTKTRQASARSEFNGDDLPWWVPKLFVLRHYEAKGGLSCSPTGLFICSCVWLSFMIISDSAGCVSEAWGNCNQALCSNIFKDLP